MYFGYNKYRNFKNKPFQFLYYKNEHTKRVEIKRKIKANDKWREKKKPKKKKTLFLTNKRCKRQANIFFSVRISMNLSTRALNKQKINDILFCSYTSSTMCESKEFSIVFACFNRLKDLTFFFCNSRYTEWMYSYYKCMKMTRVKKIQEKFENTQFLEIDFKFNYYWSVFKL